MYHATTLARETTAMDTVLNYVSKLSAGATPQNFGYIPAGGNFHLSTMSRKAPKVYLALQFILRNYFRFDNIVVVRLGKGVKQTSQFAGAVASNLSHA